MNILKNINVVKEFDAGVTKKISGSSMNQNLPMIDKDIKTVLISDPITDWET
jgi:hypothetical protein